MDTQPIYVYIIQMVDNRYYTGLTQDIIKRFEQHNQGQSKSTKWYRPLTLIYVTETPDRKTARRLEIKIKNITAKRYLLHQRFRPNRPYQNIIHTLNI